MRSLCGKVSANVITCVGAIVAAMVIWIVITNPCNVWAIGSLATLRAILDCLDGGVARTCDEGSKFGKYLDAYCDFTYTIVLMCIFAYRALGLKNKKHFGAVLAIALIPLLLMIMEAINKSPGTWQDNDVLLSPMLYVALAVLTSKTC